MEKHLAEYSEYVADKAIGDLRKGDSFDDKLAEVLRKLPFIDALRTKVQSSDLDRILALITNHEGKVARQLGIALLRGEAVRNAEGVKDVLFNLWESDDSPHRDRTRMSILPRLTDYKDLSEDWHKRLYEYVKSAWDLWLTGLCDWFGGEDSMLAELRQRLDKLDRGEYPQRKAWVYLCCAMGSLDKEEVKKLIEQYASRSPDEFVRTVASELRTRL